MTWELALRIGEFIITFLGVIGGTAGIYYWKAYKKEKEANAQAASIEAKSKEADLVDTILQKFEKAIIGRMDAGETVRKQEFDQLRQDLGGQLSDIQTENRKQNDTISAQSENIAGLSELVQDIKDYLNGGFAEYEKRKHPAKTRRSAK